MSSNSRMKINHSNLLIVIGTICTSMFSYKCMLRLNIPYMFSWETPVDRVGFGVVGMQDFHMWAEISYNMKQNRSSGIRFSFDMCYHTYVNFETPSNFLNLKAFCNPFSFLAFKV